MIFEYSKRDKRRELAQKTELRRKWKRMKRGACKVKPGGGKGPTLALALLVLFAGWLRFGLVDGLLMGGLLGRLYGIATGLAFVTLAVGLTLALCWARGKPAALRKIWPESALPMQMVKSQSFCPSLGTRLIPESRSMSSRPAGFQSPPGLTVQKKSSQP